MRLELDDDVAVEWPAWRLVMNHLATAGELERLSIDDVDCACRALDSWEAAIP